MNEQPHKIREIVEEHRFTQELAAIESDSRKADDFIDGAKWVLSREARAGTRLGKSHVWFLPLASAAGAADPVVMFYTFDADHVYFLSIRKTKEPEE